MVSDQASRIARALPIDGATPRLSSKRETIAWVLTAIVSILLAIVLLTGMQQALQNALTDLRFGWFPRQASGDIVLVAIDSPSIENVGVWPWPRQKHAELIGKLVDWLGPRKVYALLLGIMAIPVASLGLANSFTQLLLLRLVIGLVGCGFVIGIRLVGDWFLVHQRP